MQLDAGFHGLEGRRNVITFITDAEKDPLVLGFALTDGDPVSCPVRDDAYLRRRSPSWIMQTEK